MAGRKMTTHTFKGIEQHPTLAWGTAPRHGEVLQHQHQDIGSETRYYLARFVPFRKRLTKLRREMYCVPCDEFGVVYTVLENLVRTLPLGDCWDSVIEMHASQGKSQALFLGTNDCLRLRCWPGLFLSSSRSGFLK